MKIHVIVTQNALLSGSGSPRFEERKIEEDPESRLYNYQCVEVPENFEENEFKPKDLYPGGTYRCSIVISNVDIDANEKQSFLNRMSNEADAKNKFLTKSELILIAEHCRKPFRFPAQTNNLTLVNSFSATTKKKTKDKQVHPISEAKDTQQQRKNP